MPIHTDASKIEEDEIITVDTAQKVSFYRLNLTEVFNLDVCDSALIVFRSLI